MTRRRQFGSVRRLPSGRWQARYRNVTGQLVTAPRTFPTKTDAGRYESQLRLHILPPLVDGLPALGDVALADLTPELVRAWYSALTGVRGQSAAATAYVRLRQVLNQAVNDDRLVTNPCRIEGAAGRCTRSNASHLWRSCTSWPAWSTSATARSSSPPASPASAKASCSASGVATSICSTPRSRFGANGSAWASGEIIEDGPKSEAGRRSVALSLPLVAELERHLSVFTASGGDAYVFTSATGEPLERSNFRGRVWVPATRAAGLEGLRFHDLRHTAGTLAARTGATRKELMARLGHASPRAAMVYQHAAADRDRLIADRLGAMVTEAGLAPVIPLGRRPPASAPVDPPGARARRSPG